jgi:hypothetical protein
MQLSKGNFWWNARQNYMEVTLKLSLYFYLMAISNEPLACMKFGIEIDHRHTCIFSVKCCLFPKGYHLDVVGGPSTPHDPESDAGGSLSSWQGHPSR